VIKSRAANDKASVTLTLDPRVSAQTAAVCGEWNGWSADIGVMRRDAEGRFSLTVDLDAGRTYRFRYLLDGERWDNDWAADAYVPNGFGGDDSVVDLTRLAEAVQPPLKKAPVKKQAVNEQAVKKQVKKETVKKETVQATKKLAAPATKPAKKTKQAKKTTK